jgi:hypothetical protein
MRPPSHPAISAAARAALLAGRKIEAVKIVRRETGLDLATALACVEAEMRADPTLAAELARQQTEVRARARVVLWVAVGLVLLAAWFVFGRV